MPWARLDDKFWSHPKIVALPHAAVGLFCRSLSYAADQTTNGAVPRTLVDGWKDGRAVKALVAAGLWTDCGEVYVIHDYLDYNPSRDQVLQERKKARERRHGARSSPGINPESGRSSPGVRPDSGFPVPIPDPELHPNVAAGAGSGRARERGDGGFQSIGSFLPGSPRRQRRQNISQSQDEMPDEVLERLKQPPIDLARAQAEAHAVRE